MPARNEHYPVEIFGYPIDNMSAQVRANRSRYWCPFMDRICDKQSRTIPYPMGVCSVLHRGSKIAICPHRFLQDNITFVDVCNEVFGTTNNVLLFREVGLRDVGNFDFVLVKHKPLSSEVEDFCIVEFETDSTTQTGKLVAALKDFIGGVDVSARRYNYGMNTYNTIKLSYIQMLYKGQVLQKWNKKIVWICQAYVFENMVNRFNLSDLDYESRNSTLYFVYDLVRLGDNYKLQNVYKKSSTIDNLLKAFTEQPAPNVNEFISILERKIRLDLGITFT